MCLGHLHRELESGTFVFASGGQLNFAARVLDDLLTNGQAHADTILIVISGALHFTEHLKKLGELVFAQTTPFVDHLDVQVLVFEVIAGQYSDGFTMREFEGVFGQVDQDLLQPCLIAHQQLRHLQLLASLVAHRLDLVDT